MMVKLVGYVVRSKKTSRWVYGVDDEFFSCVVDSSLAGDELVSALVKVHTEGIDEVCGERWLKLAQVHGMGKVVSSL
jgi:hypothetical protein